MLSSQNRATQMRGDALPARAIAGAGLIALAIAMGIGRFAFTPMLPMMQQDQGLSVVSGAWLASANYFGYLIGALGAAWLRSHRPVIRASLAAIGMVTVAMAVTDDLALWLFLRTAAGVASALVLIHASAWSLELLSAAGRPQLSGAVFAGVGAGIALAGSICLALMYVGASSAQTWTVLGVLALAFTAVVWLAFSVRAIEPHGAAPRVRTALHWNAESVRLVLCYGVFGFGYIIPATFLPAMARGIVQEPLIFGWSWPIFGAAALVSTLIAAPLAQSLGNRRVWMGGQLMMAMGVALPVVWHGIAGIMVGALFVGGTFMVVTMMGLREARTLGGAAATALIAAMTAAFAIGQIAGPIAASLLVDSNGSLSTALLLATALLAMGAFILPAAPLGTR